MTIPSPADRVTMRTAVPADYPALLDIQHRAYRLKESPLYGDDLPPLREMPETLAEAAAGGTRIVVGELEGRVVASLRIKVLDDGAVYWCRLSVDPDRMGQGIGQRMVRGVEELYPDAPAYVLDCGEKSEENRHIYSKMGYVETGETEQVPGGPLVRVMRKARS